MSIKKNGKHRGIQRCFCTNCHKSFSSKRRPNKLQSALFDNYIKHRFTLKELANKHNHSRVWIQNKIHSFSPEIYSKESRDITAVIDVTFFGSGTDKFGLIAAKDTKKKEIVAYNFIKSETKEAYRNILSQLSSKGFRLKAVTLDGKPGIMGLFKDIPIQMCHFHMQKIITTKLTRRPKLEASKELKRRASKLSFTSEYLFTKMLDNWYEIYKEFINEKVEDESKRGWHYKHRNVRSAYRSLRRFLPYLFTYQKHPDLNIPNTTNILDGGCFSPLKERLHVHRGTSTKMKRKMIVYFIENRRKKAPKTLL